MFRRMSAKIRPRQKLKSAELPPNYGYTDFQFNVSNYRPGSFTGIGSLLQLFDRSSLYGLLSEHSLLYNTGQLMEIITSSWVYRNPRTGRVTMNIRKPSLSSKDLAFK